MRVRRPKTKTKRCAHCRRRRLAKFIEWHGGIMEWQCSSFSNCNRAIEANAQAIHPRTSRVCGDCRKFQKPKKLVWNQVACNWLCEPKCVKWVGYVPRALLIAMASLALSSCAMSKHDIGMEVAFAATATADMTTSIPAVWHCGEQNPLVGACGDGPMPLSVYFPAVIAMHTAVTLVLPHGRWRTTWQAMTTGWEGAIVYRNFRHRNMLARWKAEDRAKSQ